MFVYIFWYCDNVMLVSLFSYNGQVNSVVIRSGFTPVLAPFLNGIIFFHSFTESARKNMINLTVESKADESIHPNQLVQPEIVSHFGVCVPACLFSDAKNDSAYV